MVKQVGFTLIELMIVVAIIGVLSAIAIPNYQSFIAKSQTAEAVIMLDSAKTNIEDSTTIEGEFPQTVNALTSINTQIFGTYGTITGTANTINNASYGDVIYKFSSNGVNQALKSKSIWYSRSNNSEWSCGTNLPSKYAPLTCIQNLVPPTGT